MIPQAYIAGPYSNPLPDLVHLNVKRATAAAWFVAARGYLPIIPHTMGPHHGVTWEGAMARCRDLVRGLDPARDILVTLPTWEDSPGAREEVGIALACGVRVIPLMDLGPLGGCAVP
jgi:triacylglycerol esterase/lipase EstA (alpha/beta hydrolase family)